MIIITGASDGLGKELARIYLEAGKKVIGISRGDCAVGVEHLKTDLMDMDSISSTVNKINVMSEPIEALVNCAGVLSLEKTDAISEKEIERLLVTNVKAPMFLTSGLIDKIKQDKGDIVNVASTVGLKGYVDQAAYGASKWAMRGFSQNLQAELKDYPCRVISFCPGGFKTKFFAKATGVDNTTNAGEWMRPADLAMFIKQILDLPKNMEVSEVIVNRKQAS
jgi:NADP-dependent 3-hydroxy acid dehydrogenase YdfG